MSDDMIGWLRQQLDDDEELARDAGRGSRWKRDLISCVVSAADNRLIVYGEGTPTREQADHIARHDPARVLREVEAKRLRIELIQAMLADDPEDATALYLAQLEALPYADREGYREEWRRA